MVPKDSDLLGHIRLLPQNVRQFASTNRGSQVTMLCVRTSQKILHKFLAEFEIGGVICMGKCQTSKLSSNPNTNIPDYSINF